ncbi:EamA family transporter RarD [Paenibacillus silvae]|jgi:chloramphenicol-sensitive protein RarD|uniref:EamA family transporter n=1 Tax=Paenibacillus silvae TaxID=1325358 RepID=A0ABQ1ZF05_9BACL|nr:MULTISPECIES: EamA family transporter RarD [Paenibacillus]MBU5354854.1 EamA family transporter RarD [Paenibacillus barcinonensis]MCK6076252.1 EamA family transporter RarD [Paenibacillus silvae]MCK6150589.1 EamA family transporter RarD [Paenibacillus silvae]MCK6268849.1 EamA family transporter RarD [Paenibacillus silvae]MCK6270442.1 EamA family transporter RarD [Paenibacillus silvae]
MNNGLINAIIAYIMWGVLPLYWKLFNDVPAGEILSHRVVWSFVFMGILVAIQRRWSDVKRIWTSRSLLLPLTASGLLIAINWLIFIWAVNNGHVVETSLGYYLNPLLNVLLAVVFLHEKPNRGQWLAIAIAAVAVLIIAIDYGRFPWIAISLAASFGLYGLAKKKIKQDASVGLLSETAIVLPLALGYWIYLGIAGQTTAWTLPPTMFFELLLSGVVTALPLLFFARAAARMSLSTLGFVQYIGPTIMLILSIFVFKESVSPVLLGGFALIWTALIVYAAASMRAAKLAKAL